MPATKTASERFGQWGQDYLKVNPIFHLELRMRQLVGLACIKLDEAIAKLSIENRIERTHRHAEQTLASFALPIRFVLGEAPLSPVGPMTLRDLDNRDEDGDPYEFTGSSVESVVSYLDGPLRRDLATDEGLDDAVGAVRSGDLETANRILNRYAVYLSWSGPERCQPTVDTESAAGNQVTSAALEAPDGR